MYWKRNSHEMLPILIASGQDKVKELLYKENMEEHAANLLRKSIKLGIMKIGKMTKKYTLFYTVPTDAIKGKVQ